MTSNREWKQQIRQQIRELRAARHEDTRMCKCGHTTSGHLVRMDDGEAFHCCQEGCICKKYDEAGITRPEPGPVE